MFFFRRYILHNNPKKMFSTTFTLANITLAIESTVVPTEQLEMMCKSMKFIKYINGIDFTMIDVQKIRVDKLTWFCAPSAIAPEKLGFIYMEVISTDKRNGKPIPGVVFLRGNAVAIDIDIDVIDENGSIIETVTPFTKQIRMGSGKMEIELPAGMCDSNGDIFGVAMKEIEEETGLKVPNSSEMIHRGAMNPSVGGTQEKIDIFYWKTSVSVAQYQEMRTKIYGNPEENETIQLVLVEKRYKDMYVISTGDAKAMCARFFALAK